MPDTSASISDYMRDPTRLVDTSREVIEKVHGCGEGADKLTKEAQLFDVAPAIERLDRAGISVPDPPRGRKTDLARELARDAAGTEALKQLADDLDQVPLDRRSRLGQEEQEQTKEPGKKRKAAGKRRPRQPRTASQVLRESIIRALQSPGGRGNIADIMERMASELNGKLLPGDMVSRDATAAYAWQISAKWERDQMIQDGLLRSDSPRGVWELCEDQS